MGLMAAVVEKVTSRFSSRGHLLCVLMAVRRVASPPCAVSSTAASPPANEDSRSCRVESRAAESSRVVVLARSLGKVFKVDFLFLILSERQRYSKRLVGSSTFKGAKRLQIRFSDAEMSV